MTETLQERIIRHEGFCEIPKIDVSPMYVIGFGHDITPEQAANDYASGISYNDAMNLLEVDISRCTDQADSQIACFESLNTIRQDVIIEQIFQLGINRVLEFSHQITAMEAQDWAKAAYEMVNSKWHSETPQRCEELSNLMLTGIAN